ncbi:MAG TPA: SDR family NAD(P)-dependent oxidoreductase, partial [Ilumatobacteraceae bacterium]|nr:SDR family NAD(P)-dependent oxidoreductase [Ilumatobacteraceae bacterium]
MADLADRVVIVSGVGPGLGRETALVAAREGGKVVLAARTESNLAAVAAEIGAAGGKAVYRRTDITNAADRKALVDLAVEQFGRVDALILVAAYDAIFGGIAATENFDDWRQAMEVNLYSSLDLVKCALPALQESGGSIVFVSSQTQHHPPPLALQAAYAATKGAMTGALRHVAHEIGPLGVRINEVAPG